MPFSLRAVRAVGTPLFIVAAVTLFSLAATNTACSSDDPKCDDSKCAANNKCIAFEGETKCQRLCTSNADPAGSCPFNYSCTQVDGLESPICVQTTARRTDGALLVDRKELGGQWGASCNAALGLENPECDTEQGFFCYGIGPTDGEAYCTRYGCEKDRDCGAGFYCGKINTTPNVKQAKRTAVGEVEAVCLRREYCAPCKADLDCPPNKGVPQYCVLDNNNSGFCAPECSKTSNCNNEAQCTDPGIGVKVCYPRSGLCVGDGSLCAPCRNDADCGDDGACIKGEYTTEKVCAKKRQGPCTVTYSSNGQSASLTDRGGCPDGVQLGSNTARVSCFPSKECQSGTCKDTKSLVGDFCYGLYTFGEGADIGCWTPKK